MNSLAITPEKESKGVCAEPMHDEPRYPSLCLREDQMESFLDGTRLELDKIYEVTIQFKVEGLSTKYGKSLDLCVLSSGEITEVGDAPKEEEEDDDEKESMDPVVAAVGYTE